MFGADSVVTPFPTSIGGQPPSPLSVQGQLRHLDRPGRLQSVSSEEKPRTGTMPNCIVCRSESDGELRSIFSYARKRKSDREFGTSPGNDIRENSERGRENE